MSKKGAGEMECMVSKGHICMKVPDCEVPCR